MDSEIIELFRTVRAKALNLRRPYADADLDKLLALINPNGYDTFYLGFGRVMDSHFHYIFSEGGGEAVLTVKGMKEGEKDSYSFLHVKMHESEAFAELIGFYSTALLATNGKFSGKMGELRRGDKKNEEYIVKGLLKDFAGARDDSSQN